MILPTEIKIDNYQSEKNITPQAFFEKYVGLKLSDYVSVINAPTADKPYGKSYTVEMLGNVVGAPSVRYINLPMDRFKELAIAQMKAGETVWFGSDVGQVSDRQKGILATNVYDFTASMDINLTQDKAGRLDYSESLMTHAMVLTGLIWMPMVNLLNGRLKLLGRQGRTKKVTLSLLIPGWMNTLIKSLFVKISLQLKN